MGGALLRCAVCEFSVIDGGDAKSCPRDRHGRPVPPVAGVAGDYCSFRFGSALISLNLASARSNFSLNSHIASRISR